MSKLYVKPEYDKWKELLSSNVASGKRERSVLEQSKELRTLLFSLSSYFSRKLKLEVSDIEFDEDVKIILSAHQPGFDHPGLLAKKQFLNKFACENNCIAFNIILDTDTGKDLEFRYLKGDELKKTKLFEEHHSKPYCFQKSHYTMEDLNNSKLPKDFINSLSESTSRDLIETLTVYRRTFEESPTYYEVPFSLLVEQDNFQKFIFEYFLISSRHLFYTYNNVLGIYRALKKIKNKANPFPDLKEEGSSLELPFWLVNKTEETKKPLYFSERDERIVFHTENDEFKLALTGLMGFPPLPEDVYIVPRALITTAIFRVFLSDFFIHGKGGEKYDACTDAFITSFFNFEAPHYAAVSRDLMLDEKKALRVNEFLDYKDKTRELVFHPEKYADANIFSDEDTTKIKDLTDKKSAIVKELKEKKEAKESVAEETKAIKEIEKEVFSLVENSITSKYSEVSKLSEKQIKALVSRKYPFFMFEKERLKI